MARRRSYHHGNLREALVEAATDLIEEFGPQSFSLAEAARRVQVSAAAPYRHFKSREVLLEEVARRGFVEFAERMEAAYDDGRPNPLQAFERLGECYLSFALDHPGYYMAMFESSVAVTPNSELWEASERALRVLLAASEALTAGLPPEKRPPARMVANHIWALSHGVVELFARNRQGVRSPIGPKDMLDSGVMIYLRGLGLFGN